MSQIKDCNSLEEVRNQIDFIDRQIVTLLAERGAYVKMAARFKQNARDVRAPQRVEQVISRVIALSAELGANAHVAEAVYSAMISAFIDAEMLEHSAIESLRTEALGSEL